MYKISLDKNIHLTFMRCKNIVSLYLIHFWQPI